jgi:hypothetical protein
MSFGCLHRYISTQKLNLVLVGRRYRGKHERKSAEDHRGSVVPWCTCADGLCTGTGLGRTVSHYRILAHLGGGGYTSPVFESTAIASQVRYTTQRYSVAWVVQHLDGAPLPRWILRVSRFVAALCQMSRANTQWD